LLLWSRAQSNKLIINPEAIDVQYIVQENFLLLNQNAHQKNITLKSNITKKMRIWADRDMMDTVFRNLLSNAVKFTNHNGSIEVDAKLLSSKTMVEFTITDTGLGISDENQQKLFQIDQNYTTEGTDKEKGTGLGLILCKEFIEKNGGQISVKSQPGVGSAFSFTVPLAEPAEEIEMFFTPEEIALVIEKISNTPALHDIFTNKIIPQFKFVTGNNSIKALDAFASALNEVSVQFELKVIENYCKSLKHCVSVFDTAKITEYLEQFHALEKQFD
jgi:hypothetical protein